MARGPGLGMHMRGEQQMLLLPRMLQSIEVLQLPTLELDAWLREAAESNEALRLDAPSLSDAGSSRRGTWEDAEAPPVLLDSGFDGSLFGDARFLDDLEILVEAEKKVTDQELGLLGEYRARGEPRSDAAIDEVPDLAELRTFLGGVLGTDTPPPQQRRIGVHVAIAFVAGLALGVLLGLAV